MTPQFAVGVSSAACKLQNFRQSLITQEIGDRRGEGSALWNKALAYERMGEREQAVFN